MVTGQYYCSSKDVNGEEQSRVLNLNEGFDEKLLNNIILFMGGAQDTQQQIVSKILRSKRLVS